MTERNNNPTPKKDKSMKQAVENMKKDAKVETPKETVKKEEKAPEKTEVKKPEIKKVQKKKSEAVVNATSLHISAKKARDICRFIKGMNIEAAQEYMEQVAVGKKSVPFKGEYPHRKGKIMSGGFPKNAAEEFVLLLKGLTGNSNMNGIDNPVIVEAVANLASRPYGRFGRIQKKRTHVRLVARDKKELVKKKSKKGKKKVGGKK